MTNREIDRVAKFAAEWVKDGRTLNVAVMVDICRRCGKDVYKHNGSPNWQNRFTCPKCKHSVSR